MKRRGLALTLALLLALAGTQALAADAALEALVYDTASELLQEDLTIVEAYVAEDTLFVLLDTSDAAPAAMDLLGEALLYADDATWDAVYLLWPDGEALYPLEASQDVWVWVPTKGGKKHHKDSTCSAMDGPEYVTRDEALARGFDACKRCYPQN